MQVLRVKLFTRRMISYEYVEDYHGLKTIGPPISWGEKSNKHIANLPANLFI